MSAPTRPRRTIGIYTRRGSSGQTYIEGYIDAYETNATGALIWSQCDGVRSLDDIVAVVADSYAISTERAALSVRGFIEQLAALGFIDAS